jgi:hypothetical protein
MEELPGYIAHVKHCDFVDDDLEKHTIFWVLRNLNKLELWTVYVWWNESTSYLKSELWERRNGEIVYMHICENPKNFVELFHTDPGKTAAENLRDNLEIEDMIQRQGH